MENKRKISECYVRLERCDAKMGLRSGKARTGLGRRRDEREAADPHDGTAGAVDWVKRERSVYETDELYVEEELDIEPTVLQPRHPVFVPECLQVKLEPASRERELPLETSGCSSAAGALPLAGGRRGKKRVTTDRKLFICDFCKKNLHHKSRLNSHMFIHTCERPYGCTSCDAKFKQRSDLKVHLRIHTGERPFSCTICDAKFIQSHSLKSHMRVHTGERPFSCTICCAKFTQSYSLKSHMCIHTGERPFSCTICDAKFIRSNSLKSHMRVHTGERPFRCKTCEATFNLLTHLKVHMRVHAVERTGKGKFSIQKYLTFEPF